MKGMCIVVIIGYFDIQLISGLAGVEVGRDKFTDLDYADDMVVGLVYMDIASRVQAANNESSEVCGH